MIKSSERGRHNEQSKVKSISHPISSMVCSLSEGLWMPNLIIQWHQSLLRSYSTERHTVVRISRNRDIQLSGISATYEFLESWKKSGSFRGMIASNQLLIKIGSWNRKSHLFHVTTGIGLITHDGTMRYLKSHIKRTLKERPLTKPPFQSLTFRHIVTYPSHGHERSSRWWMVETGMTHSQCSS